MGQGGVKSFWPSSTHRWYSAKLSKVGWGLGPLHPVHLTGLWDESLRSRAIKQLRERVNTCSAEEVFMSEL